METAMEILQTAQTNSWGTGLEADSQTKKAPKDSQGKVWPTFSSDNAELKQTETHAPLQVGARRQLLGSPHMEPPDCPLLFDPELHSWTLT